MKILIFTCLCQRATHCSNVALHPLQMLLVLSASHNERKDVFLQLKARHNIRLLSSGKGQKDEQKTQPLRIGRVRSKTLLIRNSPQCQNCTVRCVNYHTTELDEETSYSFCPIYRCVSIWLCFLNKFLSYGLLKNSSKSLIYDTMNNPITHFHSPVGFQPVGFSLQLGKHDQQPCK